MITGSVSKCRPVPVVNQIVLHSKINTATAQTIADERVPRKPRVELPFHSLWANCVGCARKAPAERAGTVAGAEVGNTSRPIHLFGAGGPSCIDHAHDMLVRDCVTRLKFVYLPTWAAASMPSYDKFCPKLTSS